ncbi:hypothetical protein Tco_0764429 [Tanacetum coccineum]
MYVTASTALTLVGSPCAFSRFQRNSKDFLIYSAVKQDLIVDYALVEQIWTGNQQQEGCHSLCRQRRIILAMQKADHCTLHYVDAYEKKLIQVLKIHTNDNVADLLTKAFDVQLVIMVDDEDGPPSMIAVKLVDWVPFEQQPDRTTCLLHKTRNQQLSAHPIVPDSIPEPTGENIRDHSSNDTSLLGNEDDMTLLNVYDLCISLCKQVSDQAKEIKLLKAQITKLKIAKLNLSSNISSLSKTVIIAEKTPKEEHLKETKDAQKEYNIDHMETDNAQSEGRLTYEKGDETRRLMKLDLVLKMELVLTKKKLVPTVKKLVPTLKKLVLTSQKLVLTVPKLVLMNKLKVLMIKVDVLKITMRVLKEKL